MGGLGIVVAVAITVSGLGGLGIVVAVAITVSGLGGLGIVVTTTIAVGRWRRTWVIAVTVGGLGIAIAVTTTVAVGGWGWSATGGAIGRLAEVIAPCRWGALGGIIIVWLRGAVGCLIVTRLRCALLFAWWFAVVDDGCWCHTITDGGEALVIGGLGLLGVTGWFGGVIIPDGDPYIDLLGLSGEHRYVVVAPICGHGDFITLGDADPLDGHFDVFLAITITHNQVGAGVGGTCDGCSTVGLIEANVAGSFFINS